MLRFTSTFLALLVITLAAAMSGCPGGGENGTVAGGKIPITTSSEEAKKAFLQGRDLAEKLLLQDLSLIHI